MSICCMQTAEANWAQREVALRREVGRLESQIHAHESDKAELAISASEATKPLLRSAPTPVCVSVRV